VQVGQAELHESQVFVDEFGQYPLGQVDGQVLFEATK
jgi:hypothetical protein